MTETVIFKLDKELKTEAMKKAKKEGIPLSSMLKMATKAFVAGQFNVGLINDENFNSATKQEIKASLKDIAEKKNLSPVISSVEEAKEYLD